MREHTPLRLDANLKWLFTELPFLERFDAAAAAGFTGVEYANPYDFPPTQLRCRLADAGLQQVLINTPAGASKSPSRFGYACRPDSVREFRDGISRSLEYASGLGATRIHVMGGLVPEGVRWDRAFATYVTNLAWAAEQAASTDVILVLEAMNQRDAPGFVLASVEQAASVVEAVGSESLRILYDVYHAQVQQGDVISRLRALFQHVAHVQIADPPSRAEPGTGEIGWNSFFAELRTLGYDGWIGLEYRPAGETVAGLAWRDTFTI
ncbi:hydroxypyruvate isomerase family protein [Cryobacterium aureum]|uniref:hydroxypyruvate isomerase family protein n=1 Tax=Cryobacterium aureum TaxID=995037 RepID=UPI000CF4BCD1|nr:TIM barrel protein [Cryobacterium aureum]